MVDRWTGPFHSPNQAALELSIVLILLVGLVYAAKLIRRQRTRACVIILAWCAIIPFITLLCATRSRAGWLALAAGMAVVYLWNVRKWRTPVAIIGILAIGIWLWPGSAERAMRAPGDAIEGERLTLWSSTLALVHDHPITGVGERFPALLDQWYLPQSLSGRFYTPLNDALGIASRYGLPALGVAILLIVVCAGAAWQRQRRFAGALTVAVIAAHLVAGQFQAHLWTGLALASALTALSAAACVGRDRLTLVRLGYSFLVGCLGALSVAAIAWCASASSAWRTAFVEGDLVEASPRKSGSDGPILFLTDSDKDRRRFRWEVLEKATKPTRPVVIAVPADAIERDRYRAIVAWHSAGEQTWRAARAGANRGTIIIVDPHGVPDSASGITPVRVLVREGSAFVPDDGELKHALSQDALGSSLSQISRNSPLWDVIEAHVASATADKE